MVGLEEAKSCHRFSPCGGSWIPRDLEDAAMIDGLSRFGAFIKVVMPISIAGILTAVIFAFTLVTQEFVYGVTFIPASSSYTVSVGVPTFLVRCLFPGLDDGSQPHCKRPNRYYLQFLFVAGFTIGAIKQHPPIRSSGRGSR
jgi:multiple sugar transport system permease protein